MNPLARPPLQIFLVRDSGDLSAAPFLDGIKDVIQGNRSAENAYLRSGEKLDVPVQELSQALSLCDQQALLDKAMHSLFVVFVTEDSNKQMKRDWLDPLAANLKDPDNGLIIVTMGKQIRSDLNSRYINVIDGHIRCEDLDEKRSNGQGSCIWGENEERTVWFALYTLCQARRLLLHGIAGPSGRSRKLQIFLSHAKQDGLPLAWAMQQLIDRQTEFSSWYDAKDLAGVNDWRSEIKRGISDSTIVVLRTDGYDTRPWCRQEFVWARDNGVPLVNVEIRQQLERGADRLTHDGAPTVSLADGNLFRALFSAFRENIKRLALERFFHAYQQQTNLKFNQSSVIPYPPSMSQIAYAIRDLQPGSGNRYMILHQDPPLTGVFAPAVKGLIDTFQGSIILTTPQKIVMQTSLQP
ncbi:MAG: toll/interleukin-1 receptor domain-containing protein [Verrucomicrobiota bacterium]